MNLRRIVAVILGIAAILSVLSQFGLFRLGGFDEYPFWLIWALTIASLVGAVLLWISAGQDSSANQSGSVASAPAPASASAPVQSSELADRDARIAALEARLAEAQMAAQDSSASAPVAAAAPSATTRAEFAGKSQQDLDVMFGGEFIDGAMARHFQIDYVDSKGQPSEREILVYALVYRKGNLNLDSFPTDGYSCLTFRADRVQKLKDLQTGEVVSENIGDWIVKTSKSGAAA